MKANSILAKVLAATMTLATLSANVTPLFAEGTDTEASGEQQNDTGTTGDTEKENGGNDTSSEESDKNDTSGETDGQSDTSGNPVGQSDTSGDEEKQSYEPGATVVPDSESPSGYTVHFVYDGNDSEKTITKVEVSGPFNYTRAYMDGYDTTSYTPYQYENGMYASNYHQDTGEWGYTVEMTDEDSDGMYEVAFPITSGTFGYTYTIYYSDDTSEKIADPAMDDGKINADGNHNSGDTTTSVVKGHWDSEKQSNSPNMDYVLEASDTSKQGKIEYIEYTNVDGNKSHIGVYTPAGYDPDREEPYKTIYMSHGAGGDEQDWFHMGSADDIMDNYVAEGITEGAIIVTMDNTALSFDKTKTLPNILNNIIPLVESKYNVSTEVKDRAMLGLSAGAMTTTYMFTEYADQFGYFGMFSGASVPDSGIEWKEMYSKPIIMVTTGTTDFASSRSSGAESSFSSERLDNWLKTNVPDTYVTDDIYVKGSHDWFEWPQSFAKFLKEVAWKDVDGNTNPDTEAKAGVTVNNHTITFAYDDTDEKNAVSVKVTGNFQWYKEDEVTDFQGSGDNSGIPMYDAYEYEDGMFNSGYGLTESAEYEMTQTRGEHFELSLTVPGNLYYYDYVVTYADGTSETIKDPANLPEANSNGHDAGHSLVYVGSSTDTEVGQEYIYPRTDGKTGTTKFVTYTAIDGSEQPLEVYLPYGYSVRKTYKTIYISHGGGGNEAEWMSIGAVANIMDNLIAEGEIEPTIVVAMDNTYFGWDYDQVLPNVVDYIIPYIEENYTVSESADDRAFCGLSMGSMTTNQMAKTYPDEFRFFGSFSGGSTDLDESHYNVSELNKDVLYLTAGCIDMAYNNTMGIASTDYTKMYDELGVDYTFELKNGAHDWGVWRASFTTFAKDYLWNLKKTDDGKKEDVTPESKKDSKSANTSDSSNTVLYLGFGLVAIITLAGVVVLRKKYN